MSSVHCEVTVHCPLSELLHALEQASLSNGQEGPVVVRCRFKVWRTRCAGGGPWRLGDLCLGLGISPVGHAPVENLSWRAFHCRLQTFHCWPFSPDIFCCRNHLHELGASSSILPDPIRPLIIESRPIPCPPSMNGIPIQTGLCLKYRLVHDSLQGHVSKQRGGGSAAHHLAASRASTSPAKQRQPID